MKKACKTIRNGCFFAGLLLAVGTAGCGEDSADVAYESAYAGDYYYPADVGYAGAFVGGGYYAAAGARTDAITARGAVGQAIRDAVAGGTVCADQVTVTPQTGTAICGEARTGVNIVFSGCQLSGGGTIDGTVAVQLNRSASDANCDASTEISLGYTSTITDLTYTGTDGGKIVIPTQTSTATLDYKFGQAPTTVSIATNGQVQHLGSGGDIVSDRTYTGTQTLSSISVETRSYTLAGVLNVTDAGGGTATLTGTGLTRETSCCRPTGGTLAVSRTGGSHSGSHTWTFTPTCGAAMLDDKSVTLPDCL